MPFINPIEILELQGADIAAIDATTIKKAKRKLIADIDLSDDGQLHYNEQKLSRSDCEKAVDDLDNQDHKEYYFQLATAIKPLNNYLVSGEESFFAHFKYESIYQIPDFIQFINPYFAQQFDHSLVNAFKKDDSSLIRAILRTQMLVNSSLLAIAFKSLNAEIQNRITEIDTTCEVIKSGKTSCTDALLANTLHLIKAYFPLNSINALPTYFQSQINKIGQCINYLQLAIWEKAENTEIPFELLSYLLQLNIESIHKPTFERNFAIVKKRNDERRAEQLNKSTFEKWAAILAQINLLIDSVDKKTIDSHNIIAKLGPLVSIDALNSLPVFADEIRIRMGYALRSLSISCWNSQDDINTAIAIIRMAVEVRAPTEDKEKIAADLRKLSNIKAEKEKQGEPISSAPTLRTVNGIGTTIYDRTLYFVFLGIPILPIARYNCMPIGSGYRFFGKLKLHTWQRIWQWGLLSGIALWILIAIIQANSNSSGYSPSTTSYSTTDQPSSSPSSSTLDTSSNTSPSPPSLNSSGLGPSTGTSSSDLPILREYKTVPMKNGNIRGCTLFSPQYDRDIDNKLIITAEMTDAAVKIIDNETGKCIRFVFIKDGTTYVARNIPEGRYYLKIAYGHDWFVRDGDPSCLGHFTDRPSFKRDDDLYNFNKQVDFNGNVSIPYYTLKLYRTYSSDYSTQDQSGNSISEQDFNDN
jgi:hypothetical protein